MSSSLLVQHLSSQSSVCVADCARLARLVCDSREAVQALPRALGARQTSITGTAELLHLTSPALSELEQSLKAALQSAQLLTDIQQSVCAPAGNGLQ